MHTNKTPADHASQNTVSENIALGLGSFVFGGLVASFFTAALYHQEEVKTAKILDGICVRAFSSTNAESTGSVNIIRYTGSGTCQIQRIDAAGITVEIKKLSPKP